MIEIPDVPTRTDCATCGPLVWLYSARRKAWVAFIPDYSGGEHAIRPHLCEHAQDASTWRQLPHGSPPTPDYLAAKAALGRTDPAPEETTDDLVRP